MNRKVHFAEPDGLGDLLLSVDRYLVDALLVVLDECCRLHEHAATSRCRIENLSMKRLDDFHDQLDDADRREKLAALLSFGHRKLAKKILVNLAEGIPFNRHGDG